MIERKQPLINQEKLNRQSSWRLPLPRKRKRKNSLLLKRKPSRIWPKVYLEEHHSKALLLNQLHHKIQKPPKIQLQRKRWKRHRQWI